MRRNDKMLDGNTDMNGLQTIELLGEGSFGKVFRGTWVIYTAF